MPIYGNVCENCAAAMHVQREREREGTYSSDEVFEWWECHRHAPVVGVGSQALWPLVDPEMWCYEHVKANEER